MGWKKIGGPAHSLAIFANRLAALTPDRSAVFLYHRTSGTWTKIGGPADALVGGAWDLYAVAPGGGALWRYDGDQWSKVGTPGAQFVGICNAVYGLTPACDKVYRYDRYTGTWTQIGGPAHSLVGGGAKLYATTPSNDAIWEYSRVDRQWQKIGGPGAMFVGVGGTVYGLTPDKSAVYRYNGVPESWTKVGGPAASLIGGGSALCAIAPDTQKLWRYRGTGQQWDEIGTPGTGFVSVGRTIYAMTPDKSAVYELDEANAESQRLRDMLYGVYDTAPYGNRVVRGFLVKRMNGEVLAEDCAGVPFQPLSTLKLLPYLHCMIEVDKGNATLAGTTVSWIEPTTGSSAAKADTTCLKPGPGTQSGSAPFKDALPTMMWESHNRTLDAVLTKYGPVAITKRAQSLGLTQTEMYFGCPQPNGSDRPWADNMSTLADFARIFEGVEGLQFVGKNESREAFLNNMIVLDAAPGTSYMSPITGRTTGPLSNEFLRGIVQREAGPAKAAIVSAFMQQVVVRGKGGSGGPSGDEWGNSDFLEVTVPFKKNGTIVPAKFIVGWYVYQMKNVDMPFPSTADLYQYMSGTTWKKIGGPGAQFVGIGNTVFGLTPDKSAVYRYNPSPGNWTKVGGPAKTLVGGGTDLYAINPSTGDIWRYTGSGEQWQRIGGPGALFVAAGSAVCALNPDRSAVFEYNGTPDSWTRIGGRAVDLVGGGSTLYAIAPSTQDIYRYMGTPDQWQKIGGPGAQFVASGNALFALTPDRSAVYAYNGTPNNWTQIGSGAHSLAMFGATLCGLTSDRRATFKCNGSPMSWTRIGDAFASLVGGGTALYAPASITESEMQALQTFRNEVHAAPIRLALATW